MTQLRLDLFCCFLFCYLALEVEQSRNFVNIVGIVEVSRINLKFHGFYEYTYCILNTVKSCTLVVTALMTVPAGRKPLRSFQKKKRVKPDDISTTILYESVPPINVLAGCICSCSVRESYPRCSFRYDGWIHRKVRQLLVHLHWNWKVRLLRL